VLCRFEHSRHAVRFCNMRLSSRPAKRGGGTARSAVGGASDSPLAPHRRSFPNRRMPPPPRFAWSPSPAPFHSAGADSVASLRGAKRRSNPASRASPLDCFATARNDDAKNRSRDAHAPELCRPRRQGKNRLKQIREARRRKAHANHVRAAATDVAIHRCLRRGCAPLSGARSPSGASPRHSPPAITPMAQPQTGFPQDTARKCFARSPHNALS
jgi:hypothetical protein